MADPSSYRPRPGEIPLDAGVYRFRDADGRVIYVGKAKSLRSRLSSYFQDISALHPRTRSMVTTGASVEWTVVSNEVEALQLEYSWIKEFDPRFNVKYRDDKSYPSPVNRPRKIREPGDIDRLGGRQTAGGHHAPAREKRLTAVGGDRPAMRLFVPHCAFHLRFKLDVAAQVVPVGDVVGIAQQFCLRGIAFGPAPFALERRIE